MAPGVSVFQCALCSFHCGWYSLPPPYCSMRWFYWVMTHTTIHLRGHLHPAATTTVSSRMLPSLPKETLWPWSYIQLPPAFLTLGISSNWHHIKYMDLLWLTSFVGGLTVHTLYTMSQHLLYLSIKPYPTTWISLVHGSFICERCCVAPTL